MPKGLPIGYIKKWGISKLAWKKFHAGALTKGVPTRTASIKKRLKGEKMAKRRYFPRRRSRRGGMTIPIAPIVGLAAGLAEPISLATTGYYQRAIEITCRNYTGYDPAYKQWRAENLVNGLLPLVAGLLVHKFVGGKPLNFNGMLARAKVPLIRI